MAPSWLHVPKLSARTWQQAVRLIAACALSFGAASLFGLPERFWSLITAIVVMQPDLSHTLTAGRDRVIATLLGAVVGIGLIAVHQQGVPTLPLFGAGLVPLAFVTAVWPSMRLSCTTLVIVLLIPSQGDPYSPSLFRVLEILIGAFACIVVSVLVFPHGNTKAAP